MTLDPWDLLLGAGWSCSLSTVCEAGSGAGAGGSWEALELHNESVILSRQLAFQSIRK